MDATRDLNAVSHPQQEHYRQVLIALLQRLLHPSSDPMIQTIPIIDTLHDHYQLLDLGWSAEGQRVFLLIIHIDLIDGKVWIQENRTDVDLAHLLLQAGIEQQDIVLGLHPPTLRCFGEYAIG
ncbi:MAG: XisI protein [Elainella sp.]